MSTTDELKALREDVERLTRQVGLLEDANAVRCVQHAYGYYMDKGLYQEVVELFADDGEVRFMGGIFRGKATGVARLYISRFRTTFTHGRNGPVFGLLLDHMQLQDIVDVAADGRSARGRFRALLQGGADWQFDRPDGVTELEALYLLRTQDGAHIQVHNRGLRHGPAEVMSRLRAGAAVAPEEYYFRATPSFSAPAGRYEWLNRSLFLCTGARYADAVRLWMYRVT